MGGFGAEPGASTYDDNDAERYNDDCFEEQESTKKLQGVAGQVHPLNAVDDDVLKPVVIATKPDQATDGGGISDESEEDGGGGYSDDDFEGDKKSTKEITSAWSDALRGKSEEHVSPAAPVRKSIDDNAADDINEDDEGDEDDVSVASEAIISAREKQATRVGSENGVVKTEVDLVSIHARRDDPAILPLPVPSPAADPTSQESTIDKVLVLKQLRLSEKRAAIAAKRVTEYKETQAQHQTQQAAEAAATKKKREQFRASNRKIYEQIGVSKLTGEQRYQLLAEGKKLLKQNQAAREKLERHQRWYNAKAAERSSVSRQECQAPAHIAELQVRSREASRQRYRDTVGRAQSIKAQQAELHKQVNTIIAKCTHTEYVRGSYLLKQTPKKQP